MVRAGTVDRHGQVDLERHHLVRAHRHFSASEPLTRVPAKRPLAARIRWSGCLARCSFEDAEFGHRGCVVGGFSDGDTTSG
jgi:hypothetical protein